MPFCTTRINIQLFIILTLSCLAEISFSQTEIRWQRTFGTQFDDQALLLFNDSINNMYVVSMETHADFAGNIKPYMSVIKLDQEGNQIWRSYHDVAFNTFNAPYTPEISGYAFTEEWDQVYVNLIITIGVQKLLYKIQDSDGQYAFFEYIPTTFLNVEKDNERIQAWQQCSAQISCYGPDSLVVERYDPSPDSIFFDPIEWRFELKQNIRTNPIQGHYDFDLQAVKLLDNKHTLILAQIQQWSFQFCTDCNDAFIDAYNHIFKLDPEGNLITHRNIKTSKAIVSNMRLISATDDQYLVAINDINQARTKVITTLYWLNSNLNTIKQLSLDNAYPIIREAANGDIIAMRHIFDPNDPNIYGFADIYWTRMNSDGEKLEVKYWGGSDFDLPRALLLFEDGSMVFLAETASNDHDVEVSFGSRDAWLVKISQNTTSTDHTYRPSDLIVYPNPASQNISVEVEQDLMLRIYNTTGQIVKHQHIPAGTTQIPVDFLMPGIYVLQAINNSGGLVHQTRIMKI